VQHFQILAWPEGENPASLPGLLEVLQDPEVQYPLLVHSHNGVGRTGVMICIHRALKCVSAGGNLDLPGIVRHMRQQRGGMIQTFEQYKTCISGVLRYLQYVTGYTTMSIEDGAATSLPLLDIIHPRRSRTVTAAAHPLVANVAKQHAQIPRTFSDPTLQGSPQAKRLYLQNMIPPPPTYPPPYSDDDAARAPTSPQVPVSPPPPMTPPDNELSATASGPSPMQLKEDTTTEDATPTTNKPKLNCIPSSVVDGGDQIEVLFDADASILQRDTMRASQHDTTAAQLDEELKEETTEEPYVPTKTTIEEGNDDDDFTKTFGSLEKLLTKKASTSSEVEVAETTIIEKTSIEGQDPLEQINTKVSLDTEQTQSASQQSEVAEIQDTENEDAEPSTTIQPTIEETQASTVDQQQELITQATEIQPTMQQTEPFSHQEQQKLTSVGDTGKLFGGMKHQSKSFTNVWKQQNSIGELARKFGGTKPPSITKQSKSFSYQPKQQTPSQLVGDLAKMFGGQDAQPPPSQPSKVSTTSPQMENQTLTFTFDDVDGEFSEMKLTRSVETQPETNTEPTQLEQVPRNKLPDTSTPRKEIFPKTDDSSKEFHKPTITAPTPKTFDQKQQRKVKKLDMSKFAMFGESIHD